MKYITLLIILLSVSCTEIKKDQTKESSTIKRDSVTGLTVEEKTSGSSDTVGVYKAPIKVTKAVFFEEEYSNYKSVRLTYTNVSGKVISAVKFKWYGENAFGEPADAGGFLAGYGSGFMDDKLRPGKTTTGTWSILSRDGKKILRAWAYEVAFEDGTKWALKTEE